MSNTVITFTMRDLEGVVVPNTLFQIVSGRPNTGAIPTEIPVRIEFETDENGEATVTLASSEVVPYFISKVDGSTESVISYKFFVPQSEFPLASEMLYVDLGPRMRQYNDKSIAALIEAKVVAVNAKNQVQLYLASHAAIHTNIAAMQAEVKATSDAYLGSKSAPPTVRKDGSPLVPGDQYYSTASNGLFIWNSLTWIPFGSGGSAEYSTHTATAGQTVFAVPTQPASNNAVDVFINGITQARTTFTVSSTAITLSAGASAGDTVEVRVATLSTAGAVAKHSEELVAVLNQTNYTTTKPMDALGSSVFLDGAYQHRSTYNIAGANSLQFSEAPPAGTKIEIVTVGSTSYTGGVDLLKTQLAASNGASLVGFGETTTVEDRLRESVSILDYATAADRNTTYLAPGSVNLTYAAQAATNTGYPVEFPSGWTFQITGVTYSGKVTWFSRGGATIVSDGPVLSATNAADSAIDNLTLNNITAPWIIIRNPLNWAASVLGTLQQSNSVLGYMPTVNDGDVWPSLTPAQKNQTISPSITLDGECNIIVSRIKGRFAVVVIKNAVDSVFRDCNIRGGKSTYGALVFDNSATQNGIGNRAVNNKVRYSANNGVCFSGNADFDAIGNNCSRNGESGVKTYQNSGAYNYRGSIVANQCNENTYDGIDAASSYPYSTTVLTYHNVNGNRCYRNGGTGMNIDGQGNSVENNHLFFNGKNGILAVCTNSLIGSNKLVDNNQLRNPSTHELTVDVGGVTGNSIVNNKIWSGAGANSNAIYVPSGSTSYIANNFAKGSSFFFGNPGAVNSVLETNIDVTTGLLTTQSFTVGFFNNGAAIQHYIITDAVTGGSPGYSSSRINGATSAFITTPNGADASTAFAAGVKIGSAAPNSIYLDTAAQAADYFQGISNIAFNDSGNPIGVRVGLSSININGVTRNRLCLVFFNSSTGAAFPINTSTIPSGKTVQVTFFGKVA